MWSHIFWSFSGFCAASVATPIPVATRPADRRPVKNNTAPAANELYISVFFQVISLPSESLPIYSTKLDLSRPCILLSFRDSSSHLLIPCGSVANDGTKIIDEMRLIKVPEFQRHLGPVKLLAGIEPLNQFVQTVPPDHPLGINPNILVK